MATTTQHRKHVSVPIFTSSENANNRSLPADGSNSRFEQVLTPALHVPLHAKNVRMHLEQASVPYSLCNVRTGVNDAVNLSIRSLHVTSYADSDATRFHIPTGSTYVDDTTTVVSVTSCDQTIASLGDWVTNIHGEEHFLTIPVTDVTVDMTIGDFIVVVNDAYATQAASAAAETFVTGVTVHAAQGHSTNYQINADAPEIDVDTISPTSFTFAVGKAALHDSATQSFVKKNTEYTILHPNSSHAPGYHLPFLRQGGTFYASLQWLLDGFHILREVDATVDIGNLAFTHGSSPYLNLTNTTWGGNLLLGVGYDARFSSTWKLFSGNSEYTLSQGLYTVTDSLDPVKDSLDSIHNRSTDLALRIARLVEEDQLSSSPSKPFTTAFMSLSTLASDSYPVHFEPNISISRVILKPHFSVHVDATGTASVFSKLLGFESDHFTSTDGTENTFTAKHKADIDRGTRELAVHCSLATSGYSANGRTGSSCIGAFPVDKSPGQIVTYAPQSDVFKSKCMVEGATIERIVWELKSDDKLVHLQGEHWTALGILSWYENEKSA